MPRIAHCIDPQPLVDGTCQNVAWIEQGGVADMLPTVQQANAVGSAMFVGLMILAVVKGLTKPPKETE